MRKSKIERKADDKLLQSPMNYTGNKYKLLTQLLPLFPDSADVNNFYDAFCGGLSVSLNAPYTNIHCSDIESPLIRIYELMRDYNGDFEQRIDAVLSDFDVRPDNEAGYMAMRAHYNSQAAETPILLCALLFTAYNALYRFNNEGKYNAPFGFDKNTFNASKRKCLKSLVNFLKRDTVHVECVSYDKLNPKRGDFVYCDPPYLITGAAYNKTWSYINEYNLFTWLDNLNANGVKFGLSNVMRHQGKVNVPLLRWSERYNVHNLCHKYTTYANGKHKNLPTQEVYICNYRVNGIDG